LESWLAPEQRRHDGRHLPVPRVYLIGQNSGALDPPLQPGGASTAARRRRTTESRPTRRVFRRVAGRQDSETGSPVDPVVGPGGIAPSRPRSLPGRRPPKASTAPGPLVTTTTSTPAGGSDSRPEQVAPVAVGVRKTRRTGREVAASSMRTGSAVRPPPGHVGGRPRRRSVVEAGRNGTETGHESGSDRGPVNDGNSGRSAA